MQLVRFRLFVSGRLFDDEAVILGVDHADVIGERIGEIGERQGQLARCAETDGHAWMIEIAFPDGEHLRWGTDADGMVTPVPLADLNELIERYI